jgi:hypothetical protein
MSSARSVQGAGSRSLAQREAGIDRGVIFLDAVAVGAWGWMGH